MSTNDLLERVEMIAAGFAQQRSERMKRRELDSKDFELLRDAGFLKLGLPAERGGLWGGARSSVRGYAEVIRTLATGDPSVALVSAMHPAVLVYFMGADVPASDLFWRDQMEQIFSDIEKGHWWGTLTSEPGSGGDILKTKTVAKPVDGGYRLTGEKHFGSGSGQTSFMFTTALAEGEQTPDIFFMDMRGVPWDGSSGLQLTSEWDGMGMCATQSHAFRLDNFPAQRIASPAALPSVGPTALAMNGMMFTAVILGVVETAVEQAKQKLAPRRETLRSFERTEWTRVVNEAWLMRQAYDGALNGIESGESGLVAARAKIVCAELAESAMTRLARVIGGASFARGMPFAQWGQDVRALGFLRPPWGLTYDQLFDGS